MSREEAILNTSDIKEMLTSLQYEVQLPNNHYCRQLQRMQQILIVPVVIS